MIARAALRWRRTAGGAAAACALLLGACSSQELNNAALGSGQSVAGQSSGGGAVAGFTPFADQTGSTLSPMREVIANPSVADVMKPASSLPEMSMGRADAPVTVIKYASMTCPYCRQFQLQAFPTFKRRYVDTGKVRFIIREFPIGFQSGLATIALRCAPPGRQLDLYNRLMTQQASWVSQEVRPDPIFRVASQVGITRMQFDACRQNQELVKSLNAVKDRGRTLGIIGTPNFFINGRLYKKVLSLEELSGIVDALLAAGPAAVATKS